MYITSLEVKNFKTLKDFKIDFNANFNVIVGENNTGKSNILSILNRITVNKSEFNENDISKINNTERKKPEFTLKTSKSTFKRQNGKYYIKNDDKTKETFIKRLEKINLIYVDIQNQYNNLIEKVIKEYNELENQAKETFASQINIDFTDVMGIGNNIYLKDEAIYVIDKYADTSNLIFKSSGIQRVVLIICLITLFKVKNRINNYILLIDEPEGNLHVKAQKKMFNLLKEFSEENQVIISTHSTVFMKELDLDSINYLDRDKKTGTFVDNDNLGFDNFKKIRDSLGFEISDTLFLNQKLIAVEGYSDVLLHTYIYNRLYENEPKYSFFTIEGADKATQNLIALKQVIGTDTTVILDNDNKGNEIKEDIKNHSFVQDSRIIMQPDLEQGELEDLFPREFIKEVISNYINKNNKIIKEKLGKDSESLIEELKSDRLDKFERFSEIEVLGKGDKKYDFKGNTFARYLIRFLKKQTSSDFKETVKEFNNIYKQL